MLRMLHPIRYVEKRRIREVHASHAVPPGGTPIEVSSPTQGWPSFVGHSPWALRISPREAGLRKRNGEWPRASNFALRATAGQVLLRSPRYGGQVGIWGFSIVDCRLSFFKPLCLDHTIHPASGIWHLASAFALRAMENRSGICHLSFVICHWHRVLQPTQKPLQCEVLLSHPTRKM